MLFNQNKQSIALKIIIHIFSPEKGDENSFLCSHLQLEDIEKMVEQKKIFKHFKPVTLFDWFWNILNVSL